LGVDTDSTIRLSTRGLPGFRRFAGQGSSSSGSDVRSGTSVEEIIVSADKGHVRLRVTAGLLIMPTSPKSGSSSASGLSLKTLK